MSLRYRSKREWTLSQVSTRTKIDLILHDPIWIDRNVNAWPRCLQVDSSMNTESRDCIWRNLRLSWILFPIISIHKLAWFIQEIENIFQNYDFP